MKEAPAPTAAGASLSCVLLLSAAAEFNVDESQVLSGVVGSGFSHVGPGCVVAGFGDEGDGCGDECCGDEECHGVHRACFDAAATLYWCDV